MTRRPSVTALHARYIVSQSASGMWGVVDIKTGEVYGEHEHKRHAMALCSVLRMGKFK